MVEQHPDPRGGVRRGRGEEHHDQDHVRAERDLHKENGGHVETQHHDDPAPAEPAIEQGDHRERFEHGQHEEAHFEELRHERVLEHQQAKVEMEGAWFG